MVELKKRKNSYDLVELRAISIWTSNLACREGNEPNQGDERMAIGLTFEEYVELVPLKRVDSSAGSAPRALRLQTHFDETSEW